MTIYFGDSVKHFDGLLKDLIGFIKDGIESIAHPYFSSDLSLRIDLKCLFIFGKVLIIGSYFISFANRNQIAEHEICHLEVAEEIIVSHFFKFWLMFFSILKRIFLHGI